MAHHVEPMDIDSDFDNKENSLHHNNVLPFTEKGYEELDVSELNMKLRYSVTPASSPMSKSYTANCPDNRTLESGDDSLNVTVNENGNLTRSLNSTINRNDNVIKSLKTLPLQAISTEQFIDSNRNASVLRPIDSAVTEDNGNITVTVSGPSDIDENLSLPSSSSSALHTPEATTPTKDIPHKDGGSPIMRGLKSVLNMFRSSQSPIPPGDNENIIKPDVLSPVEGAVSTLENKSQAVLASTPISTHRKKEMSPTKRSSPQKENTIVFSDDLEKELQWKDETTIIFSQERIPIHKLMLQQPQDNKMFNNPEFQSQEEQDLNSTVEYMDISYNDSIRDKTITETEKKDISIGVESDSEFVDCETTFTKNDSQVIEDNDKTPIADKTQDLDISKEIKSTNESGSRLKQIILDTTQDILDATLSVRPEDLLPEAEVQTKDVTALVLDKTDIIEVSNVTDSQKLTGETSLVNQPILDQTVDVISSLAAKAEDSIETQIDNITTTNQVIDQTFVNDDHPKENQDVTNNITTIQPNDQTFITNMDPLKEILNISKPADNILDMIQTLNNQTVENLLISDNINLSETVTIDNKTIVAQVTPVKDNVDEKRDESPLSINSTVNVDIPISPSLIPTPSDQTINETVTVSVPVVEFDPVKEASMTELPVDIPLPDEDDLDKELSFPDSNSDVTTPPVSLPLDLVDDIKPPEVIEIPQIRPIQESNQLLNDVLNNNTVNISTEVCTPMNMHDNGDDINNAICIQDVQANSRSRVVIPEIIKPEDVDLLPGIITTSNETVIQPNTELTTYEANLSMNEIEKTSTIEIKENIVLNVVETNNVFPMDIHESISEFNPLPDIVNQTITMSNIDTLEPTGIEPSVIPESLVLEQVETKPENTNLTTIEPTRPEVTPETTIIMQQDVPITITSDTIEAVIDTTKVIESNTPVGPAEDAITGDKLSSDLATICTLEEPIMKNKSVADFIQSSGSVTISTDNTMLTNENLSSQEEVKEPVNNDNKSKADEEIVLSENNSPFVSVIAENITEIKLENDLETVNIPDNLTEKSRVMTPPSSPPIRSKGYSFNFDDLDFNPFTTNTTIRMSPPLDSPQKTDAEPTAQVKAVERPVHRKDVNRRKTQTEKKKPVAPKRKLNSTFDSTSINKPVAKFETGPARDIQLDSPPTMALNPNNVTIEEKHISVNVNAAPEKNYIPKEIIETENEAVLEKSIEQPIETSTAVSELNNELKHELKTPSSSEQSQYFSAGTSSSESSIPSRNVFNLPEIDDVNFNPFATKSKMCQSPPPSLDEVDPFATKSKMANSPDSSMIRPQLDALNIASLEDKIDTEAMEKDSVGDISNVTASSKATVKDTNTEDEDTVEGPFLDVDDLNLDDKMSDFDGENVDMMQFTDLPQPANVEHPDNGDNGEMFIDAEAFEFLLNQNKTNTIVDSGKESLFLKFDPLFAAKRLSAITTEGVLASLAKLQKKQSTPTKAAPTSPKNMPSPIAGPSNLNVTQDLNMNISEEYNDDLNITVSKPMMVVPPAVNPVTPRNKSLTPNRLNRRSITFTSPAMAVIDRLLSLSGNNSLMHDTTVTHASREQNEADIALSQLRELLAEKEISVYTLKSESNELRDRLNTLEGNVKALENESQDRLKKINQLNNTLAEKTKINRSMAAVVEEYERTIASLIAEIAQDKKRHAEERMQLINERDEQTAHLASMEVSFSDLHSKYEKSKQIILNCKANEDEYKKSIKEFEENLTKMQNNYELLKQHATSKLNHANQELEKMNRSHEAEVLKLSAMIKRKDLHITSLEESLAQKTKANEELTAICDELINKVG